ncbi:hypothetical protein NDU88_000758 [Pleurodeles waltl]|uniref:Uncharacterized protein n=1 Tax=Pleurodeles waltl TaxID=8319 RepID=A0AAV7VUG0_PLEWA|nr:hypothetical protein NDU88_000758 [Pleurodeles waltl]
MASSWLLRACLGDGPPPLSCTVSRLRRVRRNHGPEPCDANFCCCPFPAGYTGPACHQRAVPHIRPGRADPPVLSCVSRRPASSLTQQQLPNLIAGRQFPGPKE